MFLSKALCCWTYKVVCYVELSWVLSTFRMSSFENDALHIKRHTEDTQLWPESDARYCDAIHDFTTRHTAVRSDSWYLLGYVIDYSWTTTQHFCFHFSYVISHCCVSFLKASFLYRDSFVVSYVCRLVCHGSCAPHTTTDVTLSSIIHHKTGKSKHCLNYSQVHVIRINRK